MSLNDKRRFEEANYLQPNGVLAFIHPEAKLGKNVKVWHFSFIDRNTEIGDNSVVGSLVHIDSDVKIGKNCRIQGQAYISRMTTIGNNVFLGPACTLLNDKYPPSGGILKGPVINDDAVIGGRAIIMPNIQIGKGSVVGAGSLVTKDVLDNMVVYGFPARVMMTKKEYLEKQRTWTKKL